MFSVVAPASTTAFKYLIQEFVVGAGGVLGRKLHVRAQRFGQAHRIARLLQALLPRNLELVLQMNVGSGQEHMNAGPGGVLKRLPGALDVGSAGAGQAGDDGPPDGGGNRLHGGKVAFGSDGEAGFDDVNAQAVKLVRQSQLFLHVHAASRRLLAVAKSGVEYRDSCSFHVQGPPAGTGFMLRGLAVRKQIL